MSLLEYDSIQIKKKSNDFSIDESLFTISTNIEEFIEKIPKDFKIIADGQEFYFAKPIIIDSSKVLQDMNKADPTMSSYTMKLENCKDSILKLANLMRGQIIVLQKSEISIFKRLVEELDLVNFPIWLKPKWQRLIFSQALKPPKIAKIELKRNSFPKFIKAVSSKFTIKTKMQSYDIPFLSTFCSPLLTEYINKNPNSQTFNFDFEDEKGEFMEICAYFNGNSVYLTSANIESLLYCSKYFQLHSLHDFIEKSIKSYKNRCELVNKYSYLVENETKLYNLLKSITIDNIEQIFTNLHDSFWLNDKDKIKEFVDTLLLIPPSKYKSTEAICILIDKILKKYILEDKKDAAKLFMKLILSKIFHNVIFDGHINFFSKHKNDFLENQSSLIYYMKKHKLLSSKKILKQTHLFKCLKKHSNNLIQYLRDIKYKNIEYLVFFSPEIKELFPYLNLGVETVTEEDRNIEGSPGSLQNIIFNDDIDEFIKISSQENFEYTQLIKIPVHFSFYSLSILEYSALVNSPKIFELILNNCKEILNIYTAYYAAIGSSFEILKKLINHESFQINITKKPVSSKNHFQFDFCKFTIFSRSQSNAEFYLNILHYNMLFGSLIQCIEYKNFEAFKLILSIKINFDSYNIKQLFLQTIKSHFYDLFIFLIQIFGTNNIINKNNFALNPYPFRKRINPYTSLRKNPNFFKTVAANGSKYFLNLLINYRTIITTNNNGGDSSNFYDFEKLFFGRIEENLDNLILRASQKGNIDFIQFCLNHFNRKISLTILPSVLSSLYKQYPEIVDIIFHNLEKIHNFPNDYLPTFLSIVVHCNKINIVKLILDQQFQIHLQEQYSIPFHKAAKNCNKEICLLLSSVPDNNINLNNTKLIISASSHIVQNQNTKNSIKFEIINLYLNYLNNENKKFFLITLLHDSIKYLNNDFGIHIINQFNIISKYSFVLAAKNGMIDILKEIIEIDSSDELINYEDNYFGTGLAAAVSSGHIEIVKLLLSLNNIKIKPLQCSFSKSPLYLSCLYSNYEIFILLLQTDFYQNKFSKIQTSFYENYLSFPTDYLDFVQEINMAFLGFCRSNFCAMQDTRSNLKYNFSFVEFEGAGRSNLKYMQDTKRNNKSFEYLYLIPKIILFNQSENEDFINFFFEKCRPLLDFNFSDNKESLLIASCKGNKLKLTQYLLKEKGININSYDQFGNTPLIYAVLNNSLQMVKLLCENNKNVININHQNFDNKTALSLAAVRSSFEIINYLIGLPNFDPDKSLICTAIASALINWRFQLVEFLLSVNNSNFDINGTIIRKKIRIKDYKRDMFDPGKLFLLEYSSFPNPYIFPIQDINDLVSTKASSTILLKLAVYCKDHGFLILLSKHPHFLPRKKDLGSCLIKATLSSNINMMKDLLKIAKADVNFNYKGKTLLCAAIISKDKEIINFILKSPDFDPIKSNVNLALFISIFFHNKPLVEDLLHFKCIDLNGLCPKLPFSKHEIPLNINCNQLEGLNPLSVSAFTSPEILSLLLDQQGINVNSKNFDGSTPIFHSISNDKSLYYLLKCKKIDFNIQDQKGKTVLMQAAAYSHVHIIKIILLYGDVDFTIIDNYGYSFLYYIDYHLKDTDIKTLTKEDVLNLLNRYATKMI